MNRLTALMNSDKKRILSVFFTAGFPQLEDTLTIAMALQEAGVDMIEIGMPFSDPVADGPVIQLSSKKALENGMTTELVLAQLKEIRKAVTIPVLLMGYVNPIMQYGINRFCKAAAEAGADGVILPDLPPQVYKLQFERDFKSAGLLNIFLIAPTTAESRIRAIDDVSDGFIYAVAAAGTTGIRKGISEEQLQYFRKLKAMNLKNPVIAGFGISNAEDFNAITEHTRGAIVGSAFVKLLESSSDLRSDTISFIRSLRP
ncbi:MAG: tryptophan synthase subunit alpha [Bacteroidetes bacterium]|nr:tryptophan synthase subunit alpha [Bacteroidota bacterium]